MVDKNSPRNSAYIDECRAMGADIAKRVDVVVEKTRSNKRLQGLDNTEISVLRKEEARRLKEIKKKYGFE